MDGGRVFGAAIGEHHTHLGPSSLRIKEERNNKGTTTETYQSSIFHKCNTVFIRTIEQSVASKQQKELPNVYRIYRRVMLQRVRAEEVEDDEEADEESKESYKGEPIRG